jgi:hypothetical protein
VSPPPDKAKPLSDEEIVTRRLHAEAKVVPEIELCSAVEFFENVRTGPTTRSLRDRVRLDDADFRGGKITAYPRARMLHVWNPARDEVTRESVEAWVPFDNVRYHQPLSAAQTFHYYASAEERQARVDAAQRRAREIAAAEAAARAKVMAEEAAG